MPNAVAESRSDLYNLRRRRLLFRRAPGVDTLLAGFRVLLMLFVFFTNTRDAHGVWRHRKASSRNDR